MSNELQLHEATFRAFGSNCRVVCDREPAVMASIHRLEDLEARWSRFRPTSEISALNAAAGEPVEVSAITAELVSRSMYAHERTDGRVNPLMLHQLVDLGYNTSHENLVATDAPMSLEVAEQPATTEPILLSGSTVRLPHGASLDPGGLGKGLAADLVAEDLLAAGARWVVVSLGGDMRLGGEALRDAGVDITIDEPRHESSIWGSVRVTGGGVATSSTVSRRWHEGNSVHHHVLDPTTGLPARSGRVAATVLAGEAWWADVVAKTLLIDPSIDAHELQAWDAQALVFTANGVEHFGTTVERSAA